MDNSKDSSDFEALLQKQSVKKPSILYSNKLNTKAEIYEPQDVIKSVYYQVKTIQKADCLHSEKSVGKHINYANKSQFLPVNKLPVYSNNTEKVPKQNPGKFDTQCYLDTQLLNIIEDAEAIDSNTGMTQEFDTTFAHIDENSINIDKDMCNIPISCDISNKVISNLENNSTNMLEISSNVEKIEEKHETSLVDILTNINIKEPKISLNTDIMNVSSKTATDDTVTFIQENILIDEEEINTLDTILNNSNNNYLKEIHIDNINLDSNEKYLETGQSSNMSVSPILNTKSLNRKLKTPPPIVVSLETFENFESLAMSLIEETDFKTAKRLINSQILGQELCLSDDSEILVQRNSPVLDYKTDELQIMTEHLITNDVKNIDSLNAQHIGDIIETSSDILEDEILFSSDEEDFYRKETFGHERNDLAINDQKNEVQTQKTADFCNEELPLTCVLETSDHKPTVLENTLYVGFQTASNKSIQICKDSFSKAQNILCDDSNIEEISLKDLVSRCDRSKSIIETKTTEKLLKNDSLISKSLPNSFEKKYHLQKRDERSQISESIKNNIANINACHRIQANNKNICISNKAHSADSQPKIHGLLNKNKMANTYEFVNDKINDESLLEEFDNIEMTIKIKSDQQKSLQETQFQGFMTANNKTIKISHEAIEKTKTMFQDIDAEFDTKTYQDNNKQVKDIIQPSDCTKFVGFKTANNKDIKISEEALAKTKDVFQDIGKDKKKIKTMEDIMSPPSTSKCYEGFKTASNKSINISNESFLRTKNIFEDVDVEMRTEFLKAKYVGFETATNINIKMPHADLCKTENIFKDIDKELIDTKTNKAIVGFKTARNKDIHISKSALSRTRKIFENIEIEETILHNSHESKLSNNQTISSVTEQNVAANAVTNSLNKPTKTDENIFVQCDFDELEPIFRGFENPDYKNTSINKTFVGFKTANNNMVDISSEALQKSKKLLDSIDCCNIPMTTQSPTFKGFQTASNKLVLVSEEAIEKCKIIFQDIDANNSFQTVNNQLEDMKDSDKNIFKDLKPRVNSVEQCNKAFLCFKTANDQTVNISEKSIAESKKLFNNISINTPKESSNSIFKGFQTASMKEVNISEEAIEKTKNVFDGVDDLIESESKSGFVGFKTASCKKVKISEQALAKSRHLFQDINNEEENNIIQNVKGDANKIRVHEEKIITKTATNEEDIIPDKVKVSKKLLADDYNSKRSINANSDMQTNIKLDVFNIENMLDTQVINDFDENLCTEDFRETPRPDKRPGSPILSCPKAKRRKKFETPYKINTKPAIELEKNEVTKSAIIYSFREDYKINEKYSLKDISIMENGKTDNIDPYVLSFNLENMLNFEFFEERNNLNDDKITIEEVKQIFTEATDKKLIPDGWLNIQLKLILWKLLSYEVRFPKTLGKACTVKNVIDQLKYRYDKELYNAERPILRKILEKDDIPMRTMVLCVAGIFVDGISVISATNLTNIELLLTDGWYFIRATIDNMLSKLVYDGKIRVGSKIVTCGAELVNCEQGMSPWEDISSVRLTISGNSTLPVPWDSKLGLRPTTLLSRLKSVRVGGGKISRLLVRVTRVYPSLYVEKFQDGSTVTRSERLEHMYQTKYEAENEAMIEKIYEEVQKEMSDQESQDSGGGSEPSSKKRCYETGSQIAKMMKASKDPMEFRAQLSSSQMHSLQEHMSHQRDKYLQVIQSRVAERVRNRNVVTLARGRVVDIERDGDRVNVTKGMLSIWKPNEDILDIFKEGSWIEVTNVVPTAFRNSEIQVSAGRQSFFRPIKRKEHDVLQPYLAPLSRTCYHIKDLSQNPSMTTEYNEIDTVGIIFAIEPPTQEFDTRNQFQNVYLADIDKNMIAINFWGGIKKFGYENVLDTGQVVYCGNLQKRAGNTRRNIPQYRATEFSLFTKTPKNEKARELVDEISKKMYGLDRRKFCEDCVAVKQNYSLLRCFGENQNVTPCRFDKSDYNLTKNKMFIETPVVDKVKSKAEDFNLTGLDFESTFRQQDTQELSPKTLQRKKKVNERITKLKMYGEPPPLSAIHIINKSKNATNSFKSPLVKNEVDVSKDVVAGETARQNDSTPPKVPGNCENNDVEGSPIISLNRTYVKRSGVNPVKLNFSGCAAMDKSVDHFAEEFDGSPPLSLE